MALHAKPLGIYTSSLGYRSDNDPQGSWLISTYLTDDSTSTAVQAAEIWANFSPGEALGQAMQLRPERVREYPAA